MAESKKKSGTKPILRWILRTAVGLVILIALAAAVFSSWAYIRLRASLPALTGEKTLTGLGAPVIIERDDLGVPTIRAQNRLDAARATGFLHGQERFFQMDLSRRRAAGELSELFGAAATPLDRKTRIHRFKAQARQMLESISAGDRALLESYSEGVNAGLKSLEAPPFEYLLLGENPRTWRMEDSILVVFAMYFFLQDEDGSEESMLGVMRDTLPEQLFEFIAPKGTSFDAPVDGDLFEAPPIPGPDVIDLRSIEGGLTRFETRNSRAVGDGFVHEIGSNNWAVDASHSKSGAAILANDMHLGISVPNTWYRASLVYKDDDGAERRITGVTLPGVPAIVAGSNGRVAWGFTNSYGDWYDLVILENPRGRENEYLTPNGPKSFGRVKETIRVKGADDEALEILETIWGPVVDKDHLGRRRAYRWVAHDERAVNIGLLKMESARNIEEAFDIAARTGIPAQNCVMADSAGNIGWTIMGPIPRRFGHDGRLPSSWADGQRGWNGWLEPDEYPRILDPPAGRIWTANARVVGGTMLDKIGFGGFGFAARARQIRDDLLAITKADEKDFLGIQLDNRAVFLERWQRLLLGVLDKGNLESNPKRKEMRKYVDRWGGKAAAESVGYLLVRNFRATVIERVFDPLLAPCRKADERFDFNWVDNQIEDALWAIVTQKPAHLLNPAYKNWEEMLLASADATVDDLCKDGSELKIHMWGRRNTAKIRHPMSPFIPLVGSLLDMPPTPLEGDGNMPKVLGPDFGASERMVVSPGREEEGIFHMPTGQSGHPLSPFYRAGHNAWVKGEPTPFLPGPTHHTLKLLPN
jgi:penicillin amidase